MRPRPAHSQRRPAPRGMTLLEMMIVMAIIGAGMILVRTGFRMITKADLVENATELAAVMTRANQLSVERAEMQRVVFDLEKQTYVVETCQGQMAIQRNEQLEGNEEAGKQALERGKQRLEQMPADALAAGDPDEATRRALALGGHHVAGKMCVPATEGVSGDSQGRGWARALLKDKGIKWKALYVQHREAAVEKGREAIYFFPNGSAEKAIVELTDGKDTFSVLVYGLTGRVELIDGPVENVDAHMMRNAMGGKDADRDAEERP